MYLASTLVFVGCILLSLSIKRHYLDSVAQKPYPNSHGVIMLRVSGLFCFIFSCVLLFKLRGPALGLVYFIAILTAASVIQTFLLSYLAKWVIPITLIIALTTPVYIFQGQETLPRIKAAQVTKHPFVIR